MLQLVARTYIHIVRFGSFGRVGVVTSSTADSRGQRVHGNNNAVDFSGSWPVFIHDATSLEVTSDSPTTRSRNVSFLLGPFCFSYRFSPWAGLRERSTPGTGMEPKWNHDFLS